MLLSDVVGYLGQVHTLSGPHGLTGALRSPDAKLDCKTINGKCLITWSLYPDQSMCVMELA